MAPAVAMILGKLLGYVADHMDEIIDAIREQFSTVKDDPEFSTALNEFQDDPTEKSLGKLHAAAEKTGEDPGRIASVLINKATVPV